MPDVAVHSSFGDEVLSTLAHSARDAVVPVPWRFALFGPDFWFMYQPWINREGRGRRMHTTRTGEFLMALLRRARVSACRAEMFSYLAGFLCHYALDSVAHPYVIYVTTQEYSFPRAHMSLEHALDAAQMKRDGFWGETHPVTDHYYPDLRLPEDMRPDIDAVYGEVYGWKDCWADLNRCCRRYRRCYRIIEKPRGFAACLARLTRSQAFRSVVYSQSRFLGLDPENTEHRTWHNAYDLSLSFRDSFPELREQARRLAVRLIEAAFGYVFLGEGTEAGMAALFGSNSYLSGLPVGDPRNLNVKSLLPSGSSADP